MASVFSLKCEEWLSAERENGGKCKGDSKRRRCEMGVGHSSGAVVLKM